MGKVYIVIAILLACSQALYGQTITSAQDGLWTDPATWTGGTIPTGVNSTAIQVSHAITIPSGAVVIVDGVTVNSNLTVATGGTLTFLSESTPGFTQNHIVGSLTRQDLSTLSGTTGSNLVFDGGSTYEHFFTTTEGNLPLAAWAPTSNLMVRGYTKFANATAAGNWSQSFGNVNWNTPDLTASTVNLNGLLARAQGDFVIASTNGRLLQLSTSQNPEYTIGGDFIAQGNCRVNLSTTGGATMNLGGDFIFNSIHASGSLTTTTGTFVANVAGNMSMDAPGGILRMATAGTTGSSTFNIGQNFTLTAGTLTEAGSNPSYGALNFTGTNVTHVFTNTGTIAQMINYAVPVNNTLRVTGESQLIGATGSTLTVDGTLIVESANATGAIFLGAGTGVGNVRVSDRVFNAGSRVVYGGSSAQTIGNGHPAAAGITTEIDNDAGVSLNNTSSTVVTLGGDLVITSGNLGVQVDDLVVDGSTQFNGGDVTLNSASGARSATLRGGVALTGGTVLLNSETNNATLILEGNLSGSQMLSFSGDNNLLTINGTGALGRDLPFGGATSLKALTINRPGGTLVTNQSLTVATLNIAAGTLDVNATLVVTDVGLNTGTILHVEGQTIAVQRYFNNTSIGGFTGGVLSSDAGTTLDATGTSGAMGTLAFSPTGNTLGALLLNRTTSGSIIILNSPLTIVNDLTIQDGVIDNLSGLTLASGATLTRNSLGGFSAGSVAPLGGPYNLLYTGTTNMTTGAEVMGQLNNVTSSAATVTLASPLQAVGDFVLTSGTFNSQTFAVTVGALTNSGTSFVAPSSTLTLNGNLINNATFNRNLGTVDFHGTTSISGTVDPSFQHIIVSGALTAPTTLQLHGAFTNNGNFVSGTGTVSFLGTNGVTQVVSGTSVTQFHNMDVSNTTASPDVRIENAQNLEGVLTLVNGAIFDADGESGGAVFTLLSSADSPVHDAAIGVIGSASQVTGAVTVQRYMSIEGGSNAPAYNNGRIYRFISSPVQNATVEDIQGEIPVTGNFQGKSSCDGCNRTTESMFLYNEQVIDDYNNSGSNTANDGYLPFPSNGSSNQVTFTPGRGYSIFVRGDIDPVQSAGNARWDLRGTINSGAFIFTPLVTFTSSGNVANDGWNLVGNPYPSTIDWNAATGWTKTGITNTIYMTDNAASAGGPKVYATFNGTVGTNGGSRYIPMGQAFFVKANGGGGAFTATEAVKAPGAEATFFRENAPTNVLRIALRKGDFRDETVIHYRDDATAGFDDLADAFKLNNDYLNLSSMLEDGTRLAINSIGEIDCASPIALVVSDVPAGWYALNFDGQESFAKGVSVSLTDAFLHRTTTVGAGESYSFEVTADPLSFGTGRFTINVASGTVKPMNLFALSSVCAGDDLSVVLGNSEKGYTYFVKAATDTLAQMDGTGKGDTIRFNSQVLSTGSHELVVMGVPAMAATGCARPYLESSVTVDVQGIGQAAIHIENENTLASNYAEGNTWYLNGEIIVAQNQYLQVNASGVYTLVVTSGSCSSSSELEFIISDVKESSPFRVYPNPLRSGETLVVESVQPVGGKIIVANSMGVEVGNIGMEMAETRDGGKTYVGRFDLRKLPSGIYFVQVKESNRVRVIKILSL